MFHQLIVKMKPPCLLVQKRRPFFPLYVNFPKLLMLHILQFNPCSLGMFLYHLTRESLISLRKCWATCGQDPLEWFQVLLRLICILIIFMFLRHLQSNLSTAEPVFFFPPSHNSFSCVPHLDESTVMRLFSLRPIQSYQFGLLNTYFNLQLVLYIYQSELPQTGWLKQ